MGELRFSGLSSGIDTTALVEQLMNIEGRRLANYKVDKMGYEEQTTALEALRNKISTLKSAAGSLSNIDTMQLYAANSSNKEALNVTATSEAATGSHTVEINQLASGETWIQDTSTFSYKTDYVGGGSFIYTYNNQQRIITAEENETTLQDLVNKINKDENNPGVTASLLYQGGKYHLMLSGQDTGEDYQITVDSSSTETWKPDTALPNSTFTESDQNAQLSAKIIDLDQFSGILGESDTIMISGKNHAGSSLPDTELTITEDTTLGHLIDAINQHFDGTAVARLENGQIWLSDTTSGASGLEMSLSFSGDAALELPTMAVATEGGSTVESLASLSSSYFIETQNAKNAKVRINGFPAGSANEVQTISIADGVPTTGTFRLTLNGQTTEAIAYNATAAQIQTALTALEGIEEGDVAVTGTDLSSGQINVTFGGNLAGQDMAKMIVSDDAGLDAGVISVVETTKGSDGWLHRNSNTISDALSGITLHLQDVTDTNEPVKVTVTRNTGMISKNIQQMVGAYNELISELKTKTEYDPETKELGLLSRDIAASALKTQIKNPFTSLAKGFIASMDKFAQATDIGLTVDGAGNLEFDATEFNNAISDNYKGVLELLGAAKSGNTNNTAVQFYSASDKYTTAGIYHVKIEVDENSVITSAKIKLASETEYRNATSWNNGIINFDNSFDEEGDPVNPEHSLQIAVDLNPGTYGTDESPVVLQVKQGIFGSFEDMLADLTKTDGQFDISMNAVEEKISRMEAKIEREESRLERVEERLVQKYARLEKTLTTMQQQMGAVSSMLGSA